MDVTQPKQKKSLIDILEKQKGGDQKLDDLLGQCQASKNEAESDHSLFVQRFNEAYLYYTGKRPSKGDHVSDYVEPVLFNAVKAALPQLIDSFTNDEGLTVAFRSRGFRKNPDLEKLITNNINKIFLRDNDGHQILEQVFKDCLIAGDAFLKEYPEVITHTDSETLADWVEIGEYASALSEGWGIDLPKSFATEKSGSYKGFEWKETNETVTTEAGDEVEAPMLVIRGNVPLINIEKKIIIEHVEPHDLWFNTDYGSDFKKCRYVCHRVRTTIGDAKLRGYDAEKLVDADNDPVDYTKLPALFFSRVNYLDPTGMAGTTFERNTSIDPNERPINLYEHYIYSSLPNKKGETKLYQVVSTHSQVLEVNEIKRMPFVHFKCEYVQGSFFSRSFYDVAQPYQDALSMAMRVNLDKGLFTVYPRYRAVKGQYDRQSLLNNAPGAVIEEMQSGAVQLFENYELPQTFALAQANLKESMDRAIAEAVGFQNSDGGVPQVATATAYLSIFQDSLKSQILTNTIMRTGLKPALELLYDIVKDEGYTLFDEQGQPVSGDQLPNVYDMIVDPATTHDDYAQNMQRQSVASFVLQSAQFASPVMTPQNVYAIAKDMLETSNLDASKYITDPSIQTDPQAAHEMAEKMAIESERHKVMLQTETINMRKLAAETFKLEMEAEEALRDGEANRQMKQIDSQLKVQQIMTEAQVKSEANQVKAQEVAVKNKAVNFETILAAQKHVTDITSPQINGVR